MPRVPADTERARMFRARQLREAREHRERQDLVEALERRRFEAAMAEMRGAAAERMGVKPEDVTMIVCGRGRADPG